MRHAIKFVIFIAVIGLLALQFQADDKELFMGLEFSSQTVRPNVLILMDNSGSMNNVIFYPKDGVDGEKAQGFSVFPGCRVRGARRRR